jgi:hypothetical protein
MPAGTAKAEAAGGMHCASSGSPPYRFRLPSGHCESRSRWRHALRKQRQPPTVSDSPAGTAKAEAAGGMHCASSGRKGPHRQEIDPLPKCR